MTTVDYADVFQRTARAEAGCTLDNFTPHPEYVVCRQLDPEEITPGGVQLPPNAQEEKQLAVVLKLPADTSKHPFPIQVGDIAFFVNNGQSAITMTDGTKVLLLRLDGSGYDEIYGVWRVRNNKDVDGH